MASGVIFDHISPVTHGGFRVSVQVLQVVYAVFFGASLLDLVQHIGFDIKLVTTRDGWNRPAKVVSRVAYLLCRTLSPTVLLLVLLDAVAPMGAITGSCRVYGQVFNALFVPLLNAVPLVFVIRTISLYTFDKRVCIPLLVAYAVCFGVSLSALPFWGVNLDIPGSDGWCVYDTRRQERTPYNAAWRSCGMLLDLTVILLTLHRLTEGGLGAVFRRKDRQQISASRLSATLLRQGFQYFVLIFVTDVLFLALYWSQPPSRVPFQVAGSALAFCMPPILAGKVFRDARKIVRRVQRDNLSLAMYSGSTPHGQTSVRANPTRGTSSGFGHSLTPNSTDAHKYIADFKVTGRASAPMPERESSSIELPGLPQLPRASHARPVSSSDGSLVSPTERAGGIHVGVSTVTHVAEADRSSIAELDGSNVEATVARNWPRLHSPDVSSSPTVDTGFQDGADASAPQLARESSMDRRSSTIVAMDSAPEAAAESAGAANGAAVEEQRSASPDAHWTPQTPAGPYPHTTQSQLATDFFGGAFQTPSAPDSLRQSISNAWRDPGQSFDEDVEAARGSPSRPRD